MLAVAAAWPDVIDRIAATVGKQIIAESQIRDLLRIAAYEQKRPYSETPLLRQQSLQDLINQTLIKREMELTRFPAPRAEQVDAEWERLRSLHGEASAEAMRAAGLRETVLREYAVWRVTLLNFIEYRFRPGVRFTEEELADFYEEQSAGWRREGKTPPPLAEVRRELEQLLTARYVDQALDRWLGEQRTQNKIVIR
jgi:hypothetical protein